MEFFTRAYFFTNKIRKANDCSPFSQLFRINKKLTEEQLAKFAKIVALGENLTEEQINTIPEDQYTHFDNLVKKYENEFEDRISNYQELTDSQVKGLRNKLAEISKQGGTPSIAKTLSEQSEKLVKFLHCKQYDKLTSNILKTAQQIDNYKTASAAFSYSLTQLQDLNVLFSSNNVALKNPLFKASERCKPY